MSDKTLRNLSFVGLLALTLYAAIGGSV